MGKKAHSSTKNASTGQNKLMLGLIIGAALLLVGGGLALLWPSSATTDPNFTPMVTGAPKLMVDQPVIDEGYLEYNTPIQTAFQLRNVGDEPLRIVEPPQVVLAEGC